MATSKRKTPNQRVVKPVSNTVTLKAPKARDWIARPLPALSAAILTMGWEPAPGIKSLLRKSKPLKLDELTRRELALKRAIGSADLPFLGEGLPRRVSLRSAFEFAQKSGWTMSKKATQILIMAQRLEKDKKDAVPARSDHVPENPAENRRAVFEVMSAVQSNAFASLGKRAKDEERPTSRLEKTLLRSLGALVVVLQDLAINGGGNKFLKDKKLNISAIANHVAATIGESTGSGATIPGYTERTMHLHISNALKEHFLAKRDLFDLSVDS